MADHEPIWAWQVLDERDGRWGTISCFTKFAARELTGDGEGHNIVLQTREEKIARGPFVALAETAKAFGPVRLIRYVPDPNFTPEDLDDPPPREAPEGSGLRFNPREEGKI